MKKVPTKTTRLPLILVGLIIIILCVFFLLQKLTYAPPQNIQVTNVTEQSVTISWTTDKSTIGAVAFAQDSKKITPAIIFTVLTEEVMFDERYYRPKCDEISSECNSSLLFKNDSFKSLYTHHVTLTGLDPETEYSFVTGNGLFWGDEVFSFTTAAIPEEMLTPDPIYGQVEYDDGGPVSDAIVTVELEIDDGKMSQKLSTTTTEEGTWVLDIAYARDQELEALVEFSDEDFELIKVYEGPNDIYGWIRNPAEYDQPVVDIVISRGDSGEVSTEDNQSVIISKVRADNVKCSSLSNDPPACESHGESGCKWIDDDTGCVFVAQRAKQSNLEEGMLTPYDPSSDYGSSSENVSTKKSSAEQENRVRSMLPDDDPNNVPGSVATVYNSETFAQVLLNQIDRWARIPQDYVDTFTESSGVRALCALQQNCEAKNLGKVVEFSVHGGTDKYHCLLADTSQCAHIEGHAKNDYALDVDQKFAKKIKDENNVTTAGFLVEDTTMMTMTEYCAKFPEKCNKSVPVEFASTQKQLPLSNDFLSKVRAQELESAEFHIDEDSQKIIFDKSGVFDLHTESGTYSVEASKGNKVTLYIDVNDNGVRDPEDETVDPNGFVIEVEKSQELFDYTLNPGLNFVSFPFIPKDVITTDDLIEYLVDEKGVTTTEVGYYDSGWHIQKYRPENQVFYGGSIPIAPGRGFIVKVYDEVNFSVTSDSVLTSSVPLHLNEGWNLVGIHSQKGYTAQTALESLDDAEVPANTITRWSNGKYESLITDPESDDLWGFDYDIVRQKSYFIRTEAEGDWMP